MTHVPEYTLRKCVGTYLNASYNYYVLDTDTGVPDQYYDLICRMLLREWENLPSAAQHLLDKDALAAGTGYFVTKQHLADWQDYLEF